MGVLPFLTSLRWALGRILDWARPAWAGRGVLTVLIAVLVAGAAAASCGSPPGPAPSAPSSGPPAATAPATMPSAQRTTASPLASPSGALIWKGSVALPDHTLTPGATLPGVTAAQVCTAGWTQAHRDVPEELRYQVFAEYRVAYSAHLSYEVDHLIPLELGGSNSIRNLWPQPAGGSHPGYPAKDGLENRLHELVCDGTLPLSTAQHAIAANWWAAYHAHAGAAAPSHPASPPASAAPPPSTAGSAPTVHPGAFCGIAGQRGVTTAGTPMICRTTGTDSRLRWRAAG